MTRSDWTSLSLDNFDREENVLAHAIPGDTPGQQVDPDALHEIFHEQTKQHRATSLGLMQNIKAYMEQPALLARCVMGRHRRGAGGIRLPEPGALCGSLCDALSKRATTRREDLSGAITADTLSTLLHHSARVHRSAKLEVAPGLTQYFRPYPSAGALYSCEIYAAVSAVDGLAAGIYRYDSLRHDLVPCLSPLSEAGPDQVYSDVEAGVMGAPPACAIMVTSVFERSVRKYGVRGYRLAVIEAGHILQNLSLVATGLDLAGLVSASFYEAELERLINVDGVSEAVLASFLIGQGG